jgi:hypothetical protein
MDGAVLLKAVLVAVGMGGIISAYRSLHKRREIPASPREAAVQDAQIKSLLWLDGAALVLLVMLAAIFFGAPKRAITALMYICFGMGGISAVWHAVAEHRK